MDESVSVVIDTVAVQPTTACNLDCSYCYLPERHKSRRMSATVAAKVAEQVAKLRDPVNLVWHAGEPLAAGAEHFRSLLAPFRRLSHVQHVVQTNGTLITEEWCELLLEYCFEVGVSVDGPESLNKHRVDRRNRQTHARTLAGVERLRRAHVPFSAIAVVSDPRSGSAGALYDFFVELGCMSLGINIEETVGINRSGTIVRQDVLAFWCELLAEWRANPVIRIRELDQVFLWMDHVLERSGAGRRGLEIDGFPSVAWNGDVVVLSPELLSVQDRQFVRGNVLTDDLSRIVYEAVREETGYVREFLLGADRCQESCPYFSFCCGGQAANKFFEHGTLDATETSFCRNSRQIPVDAVLEAVG